MADEKPPGILPGRMTRLLAGPRIAFFAPRVSPTADPLLQHRSPADEAA
jgi:hypothetical protein